MCRSGPWHNPSATVPLLYSDGEGTGSVNHMGGKRILRKFIKFLYNFNERGWGRKVFIVWNTMDHESKVSNIFKHTGISNVLSLNNTYLQILKWL